MESHDSHKQAAEIRARRYVTVSFALHIGLFLLFFIGNLFAPKTIQFTPSVQVDMVALPNQVKGDEPKDVDLTKPVKDNMEVPPNVEAKVENPPEPEEVKEPEPAKPEPEEMALEREKKLQEKKRKQELDAKKQAAEALKRMRAEEKKREEEDERRRQEALDKRKKDLAAFNEKYRQALRGNQKNQGDSATGEVGQAVMNAYQGHMLNKLRQNWELPQYLQGKGYRATIRIFINSRGQVVRKSFIRTSGNDMFDNNVETAVNKASPFMPPPAEMAGGLGSQGVDVNFPL